MIDEILDINLVKECTLVEADIEDIDYETKEIEYINNPYTLQYLGTLLKYLEGLDEDTVLKSLKQKFLKGLRITAPLLIVDTIKENVTKKIRLNKNTIIEVRKKGQILCNAETAKKLEKLNIECPEENLIIVEHIEDDVIYITNLKDILFICSDMLAKNADMNIIEAKKTIKFLVASIYANACVDKSKDIEITEIEIKE
ncbi:hypothetical protein [Clostridium sp.]|uniref:hypothetical protein n=1 Tax=Clostridium sp. TaxID=1506 RepID=UPI003992AB4A